jgi:BirA family biotin operon repressor/biotin-[acetyl-CoA-carboxylase] ligase
VNVNQSAFPPDLATIANSLRLASGREHSREELLVRIAESVDRHAGLSPSEILAAFTHASSYAQGRRVRIEGTDLRGVTAGLDSEGFLLLRLDDGRTERILAGGVRPTSE